MEPRPTDPVAVWAVRFSACAPLTLGLAFLVALFGPRFGGAPLAAAGLALAFVAVGFGLGGLFLAALASERIAGFVRPRWATPCAVLGIAGGFLVGLVASLRGIIS